MDRIDIAYRTEIENIIVKYKMTILQKEEELAWIKSKMAKIALSNYKDAETKDLVKRIEHDIPVRQEEIEGLNYALLFYVDRLAIINAERIKETKKGS